LDLQGDEAMRISMVVLGAVIAIGASAEPNGGADFRVCMKTLPDVQVMAAPAAVSRIFLEIGVKLDWRIDPRLCAPPEHGVVIAFAEAAPANVHRHSLAYAMPYERRSIVVFLDRIKARRFSLLLTYVLAHEIAHMLQGVARHSEVGILRPVWRAEDHYDMRRGKLTFTQEDVHLIHLGLDARRSVPALSAAK
jgi:hypothetical protein